MIAAAASFHGGRLAVAGNPYSPHLPADRITATVYLVGATGDDSASAGQGELGLTPHGQPAPVPIASASCLFDAAAYE